MSVITPVIPRWMDETRQAWLQMKAEIKSV
jgi:hypothetical protein